MPWKPWAANYIPKPSWKGDAQVPSTTQGCHGDDTQEPDFLLEEAKKIGFLLLIKTAMSGGGKGMRLVWDALEFLDKVSESVASFGDDRCCWKARRRH
jgi:3-methylcrotonyl-CoA carboxylase alpha subunit